METLTIERKQSNTGTIHDIASDQIDRDIKFPKGSEFAVVLSSYYGGKGYTTHKTAAAAIGKSNELNNQDFSHEIIDTDGVVYIVHPDFDGGRLVEKY